MLNSEVLLHKKYLCVCVCVHEGGEGTFKFRCINYTLTKCLHFIKIKNTCKCALTRYKNIENVIL